jgi:hypothetical protein
MEFVHGKAGKGPKKLLPELHMLAQSYRDFPPNWIFLSE